MILNQPVELNDISSVTLEKLVTDRGIIRVRDYLRYDQCIQSIPHSFDRQWLLPRGPITGTFPKRVRKYLHKHYGTKLTAEQISQIGNIARSHCPDPQTIYYSWTDNFTWKDGDFGDDDSCFWGGYAPARFAMMADGRWLAIRLHGADDDLDRGYGRAWVRLYDHPDEGSVPLVLNGYGKQTRWFGILLSNIFGTPYHEVSTIQDGNTSYFLNSNTNYVICHDKDELLRIHGIRDLLCSNVYLDLDINEGNSFCWECFRAVRTYHHYDGDRERDICADCAKSLDLIPCAQCNALRDVSDLREHEGRQYCDCALRLCDHYGCYNRVPFWTTTYWRGYGEFCESCSERESQ